MRRTRTSSKGSKGRGLPSPEAKTAPAADPVTCEATIENCNVRCMALAQFGNRALVWTLEQDGSVYVIEVGSKGVVFHSDKSAVTCLATDCYGKAWGGCLDGSVRVWTADFQEQAVPEQHTGAVTCIAAHEEYVYTAGGHPYGTVHKWHCGAVTVVRKFNALHNIFRGIVADGAHLYSITDDASLRVWDNNTGVCLEEWTTTTPVVSRSICQLGGTVWVGGEDGSIAVWRVADGRLLRLLAPPHQGPVESLTAVGDTVWSGGADHVVRVWHGRAFTLVAERREHRGPILAILAVRRWALDEVWTSGADFAMRIWNSAIQHPPALPRDGGAAVPSPRVAAAPSPYAERVAELERLLEEERDRSGKLRQLLTQAEATVARQERELREAQRRAEAQLQALEGSAVALQLGRTPQPIGASSNAKLEYLSHSSWSPWDGSSARSLDLTEAEDAASALDQKPTSPRPTPRGALPAQFLPSAPQPTASPPPNAELLQLLNCAPGEEVPAVQALLAECRELEEAQTADDTAREAEFNRLQELHAANLELDLLNRRLLASGQHQAVRISELLRTVEDLSERLGAASRTRAASERPRTVEQKFRDESRDGLVQSIHRLFDRANAARNCSESLYLGAYRADGRRLSSSAVQDTMHRMNEVLGQVTMDLQWLVANFLTHREKRSVGLDPADFPADPRTVSMAPKLFSTQPVTRRLKKAAKPKPTASSVAQRVSPPPSARSGRSTTPASSRRAASPLSSSHRSKSPTPAAPPRTPSPKPRPKKAKRGPKPRPKRAPAPSPAAAGRAESPYSSPSVSSIEMAPPMGSFASPIVPMPITPPMFR